MKQERKYAGLNVKVLFALLLFFANTTAGSAQTFLFEQETVPAEWAAGQGTLSVTGKHWKEGTRSLRWTTSGTSVLTVTVPAFTASTGNSAFLQVYTPVPANDTLVV